MEFEIVPNERLGEYELGTTITQIITKLQTKHTNRKDIEIIYHQKKPLSRDIQIKIEQDGIILNFEPDQQRLKMIEMIDMTKIKLIYHETEIRKGLSTIYKQFGPTHKGEYTNEGNYLLTYPGITFEFDIPKEVLELAKEMDQPIEFPKPHFTPNCKRILLYYGKTYKEKSLPETIKHQEFVQVRLGKGITIGKTKRIEFGDTPQDILLTLGVPDSIYYKPKNGMSIHTMMREGIKNQTMESKKKTLLFDEPGVDYFYNYNLLGLDVMFDGSSHAIRKMILHTNFPGSKDFNAYNKCNFKIDYNEFHKDLNGHFGPSTNVSEIRKKLDQHFTKQEPLVGSDTLNDNPFGGTKYYSYPSCIIEALQSDYINSVTLFQ